jgi:phosphate starvation-inducible PhoH-like protein
MVSIKQPILFFITTKLYLYNSFSMNRIPNQFPRTLSTLFANRISSKSAAAASHPTIPTIPNIPTAAAYHNTLNTRYQPKTPTQIEYVKALTNPETKLIIAVGPAGTGKSLFACSNAIQSLKKKQIDKIILTRPLVSVAEEDIGFLPGNLNNKMSIWVQPMIDIFMEHMSKKDLSNLIQSSVIEVTPLLYMRGRTFKNTIIIADEIQNTTPQQLLMLLTRCGDNSKIIVTGDVNQSDLKEKNGLVDFIERFENSYFTPELIKLVQFNSEDIQRSELVKQVLNIYFQPPTPPVTPPPMTPPNIQPNIQPTTPLTILQPIPPTPTKSQTDYLYMKKVNDYISKIPSEYGDYIEPLPNTESDRNKLNTTRYFPIENDCALIPKHHLPKRSTPSFFEK